uniref:Phage head maturation protease n=2 Tax=Nonomuraea gerenzanensis TaxID=93944 RepID=A0A1M4BKV0_9ACTN|nr:Phage head maturation protease [Nonomuraea gerenzanensis]
MTLTVTTEERRRLALAATGAELRADDSGNERFVGLASPFNVRAPIGNPKTWGFFEEFAPGAYTKTLNEGDQRMLIDHDSYYVVSRVSAGTLKLAQSARGLEVDSRLDEELSYVRDLKANLRNANITGMSIGFYVVKDSWSLIEVEEEGDDGKIRVYEAELRTVHEVRLIEVSAVTFPAFADTEAELNSVASALALRADAGAVERRAAHRPELRDVLQVIAPREPGESTRADETPEPGETTRRHVEEIDLAMRGLAARFPGLTLPTA